MKILKYKCYSCKHRFSMTEKDWWQKPGARCPRCKSYQTVRVSGAKKGILKTPFVELPWYHKLWLTIPFYVITFLNRLLAAIRKGLT